VNATVVNLNQRYCCS